VIEEAAVMAESALSVVREFILRFQAQNFEGVLELLSDDVVIHECDSVPYGGDHVGKDGFIKFAGMFPKVWKFGEVDDSAYRYIDGGPEKAVALASFPVTALATGTELDLRVAEIFTVRDGMVTDIEAYYWDTKQVFDATNGARLS
jgi:hypothetical protein